MRTYVCIVGNPAVEYRSGRHCLFLLHCHLVFVTKYRKSVFEKRHVEALEAIFAKVCEDFDVGLVEFDGEETCFAGSVGGAPLEVLK